MTNKVSHNIAAKFGHLSSIPDNTSGVYSFKSKYEKVQVYCRYRTDSKVLSVGPSF